MKKKYLEKLIAYRDYTRLDIAFDRYVKKYRNDIAKISKPDSTIVFKNGYKINFIVMGVKVNYIPLNGRLADVVDFEDIHRALLDEMNLLYMQKNLLKGRSEDENCKGKDGKLQGKLKRDGTVRKNRSGGSKRVRKNRATKSS